jgi:flagellar motor switch protein FliM
MTDVLSQDEIDALLNAIADDSSPQASGGGGGVEEEEPHVETKVRKRVKIYDFKRPDKFSKDQLRTLQMMHETFARSTTSTLSAYLRQISIVHVASVDQLTYDEFIRSIPSPTCLSIINMDPLKGQAVMEIDPTITFTIIDRVFGGAGEPAKLNREITAIEKTIIEQIMIRILGNLREAWSNVIDLRPRLQHLETNPQFAGIGIAPGDMVVLITLETKIGEVEGMTNFCIPYIVIEPIISKLTAQFWYSNISRSITRENFNILKERLSPIMIDIIAQLGSVDLPMRDIIDLRVGDVVKLDNAKLNSDLLVKVGNKFKFFCRPGLVGKRMAIQIRDKIDDLDEEAIEDFIDDGEA